MMQSKQASASALWHAEKRQHAFTGLSSLNLADVRGRVFKVLGPMIEATGVQRSIGEACDIHTTLGHVIQAEIVGFREDKTLMMPVGSTRGIAPGDAISVQGRVPSIQVSDHLLGHVIDALGKPIDRHDFIPRGKSYPLFGEKLNPLQRPVIDTPLDLGIRLMDTCLPMGKG